MATYDMKQFEKKLKKWGKNNPKAVKKAMKAGTELVRKETIDKHLSGPKMAQGKGSSTSATLKSGSGDLRGSINTKVTVSNSKTSGQIGSALKYARIHEQGGTIKAKNGGYLKFKIGGSWVMVKEVKIPKRAYLEPSLQKKKSDVMDLIGRMMIREYNKS